MVGRVGAGLERRRGELRGADVDGDAGAVGDPVDDEVPARVLVGELVGDDRVAVETVTTCPAGRAAPLTTSCPPAAPSQSW